MARPCECGLTAMRRRPRRPFGFPDGTTDSAPCSATGSDTLGGCGLPSVVSDACGCGEDLVATVDPRFRFPLGNAGAIAEALSQLITQPYPATVVQGRVAKFSIPATVETVKRLYLTTEGSRISKRR